VPVPVRLNELDSGGHGFSRADTGLNSVGLAAAEVTARSTKGETGPPTRSDVGDGANWVK